MAISPDGRTILAGGQDNAARFWDTATGKPRGLPLAHGNPVVEVAFSPDGKTALTREARAIGSGATPAPAVRLWDVSAGSAIGSLSAFPGGQTVPLEIEAATFTPDGKSLLVVGGNAACLWDIATSAPSGPVLWEPTTQVKGDSSAFASRGRTALLMGRYGPPRVLDPARVPPIGPLLPHPSEVTGGAISPDGRIALTGGKDRTARFWDAEGRPLAPPLRHASAVGAVAFSPDGRTAAVLSGNDVFLWEVPGASPAARSLAHDDEVLSVAFTPDGKTALTREANAARLWDVASARPIASPIRHRAPAVVKPPRTHELGGGRFAVKLKIDVTRDQESRISSAAMRGYPEL